MNIRPDPAAWGVLREYVDDRGTRRRVSDDAVTSMLNAMGAATRRPQGDAAPIFARPGDPLPRGAMRVLVEGRGELAATALLPRETPCGYHRLLMHDGGSRLLVVSPVRCRLPPHRRDWGWSLQLYALRSGHSWGIGDLSDLGRVQRWSQRLGAGVLMINPLHAALPGTPQEPSPYQPSSRIFRNPLYLDVTALPATGGDAVVAACAREAEALNSAPLVDRDRILALKLRVLEARWRGFRSDPRFDEYCDREGALLEQYATFCAIVELHGRDWRSWPVMLRRPGSDAVRRFARAHAGRVGFHRFVQWRLDEQVRTASRPLAVVNDLAVGFAPDGADAWLWQDLLVPGMTVGAPPDEFAPAGQDWGVPPFDPHRLRAAGYAPLIQTLRSAMRHGGGLRLDHVMGLFRLWWVPAGMEGASGGAYVRYPARELLDVLAIESHRAGCFVIGEDLGTVGREVRAELRRRRVLSYRVAWFEQRPPRRYPVLALAALSTHDLPTTAGLWTGSDIEDQVSNGHVPSTAGERRLRRRLGHLSGVAGGGPVADVIEGTYAALGTAPSMLITASLDDAAQVTRRPNLPGARDRPNWSIPLPLTLEQLTRARLPRAIARTLSRRG